MQDSNWALKTLVVIFLYLCLYVYVLIDAIYNFFTLLSVREYSIFLAD